MQDLTFVNSEEYNLILDWFGGDHSKTMNWFSLKNPSFGDKSPYECCLDNTKSFFETIKFIKHLNDEALCRV